MATTKIPAELVAVNAIQGTLIADNAITAVHIATNAISGTLIADNAITSTHIAENNVTATQIAMNTITVTQVADNAITTPKIIADAVTGAKIANDSIDSEHLVDGSIDTAHIGDVQVTAAKLGDNAVTLAKMASLARGSVIVGDAAGDPAALAIGSNTYVLSSDGTDIAWAANDGITTINNNADNRVITGSGTANTLEGESGLTYDGSTLDVTGTATMGTSSVGTDNTAPTALVLRHESDQTSGFDDNFGVGMKFNADASNGGYATFAQILATQKSTGYQLRFKVGGDERLNLASTGGFTTTPAAGGHAVFNEGGADADFRVESDTNANALFINASTNEIGMGRTPSNAQLDIEGGSSGTITGLRIRNSGQVAGSGIKQIWSLNRAGSSIDFEAASITVGKSQDWTTTPSTVDSYMLFNTIADESSIERMRFDVSGTIFNENSNDQDFRVESNVNTHALWMEGSTGSVSFGKSTTSAGTQGFTIIAGAGGVTSSLDSLAVNTYHVYRSGATDAGYKFYVNTNGGIKNFSANNQNLSDRREKKNIELLESQWDVLKQWSLKKFHYNADDDAEHKKYGVIAQEVEIHNPEVIGEFNIDDENTRMAVKEQQMMWMAIKALQEAQTRIETLETRLETLENA